METYFYYCRRGCTDRPSVNAPTVQAASLEDARAKVLECPVCRSRLYVGGTVTLTPNAVAR